MASLKDRMSHSKKDRLAVRFDENGASGTSKVYEEICHRELRIRMKVISSTCSKMSTSTLSFC